MRHSAHATTDLGFRPTRSISAHYFTLVKAAMGVVVSPPFESLARSYAEIEDRYMPGSAR
jgi:hypothetical protein